MKYKALFCGLTTIDIQYFVDVFPKSNLKIKTDAPDILVGGPATNAAVAFSFLNQGAYLVSKVGESAFSSFVLDDFSKNNLHFTDLAPGDTKPVIASVVTSSNGDRNIFTHHPDSGNWSIDTNEILDHVQPDIVLMDGFYPEAAISLVREAALRNTPIVLDCGSWKPQYTELLKYTDIAICSEDFMPPYCNNSNEVFSFLKELGVMNMAITRGSRSILFEKETDKGEIDVKGVEAIDTLGAGDFIHGAFCYYFLKFKDFEKSLYKASQLATYTCKFKGSRDWLYSKDMMNFL